MIVHMISNRRNVLIESIKNINIGSANIQFIDKNYLPEIKKVSAVFLVGFIKDKIITARNERGWDIPGGYLEPSDIDMFAGLQRESEEEAGVVLNSAIPFAVMRLKGKDKVMLFYVSKDCKFDKFTPKEDAFERKLMNIPEFISKYNWDKNIMELIVKKAKEVIEN